MSLISDALKTAQRERTGRAQGAKDPQPLIDGFFPYVSSSPAGRAGARRLSIIAFSGLAVVLLLVAGWVGWSKFSSPGGTANRAPIVLPPRVTVADKPPLVDTAAITGAESKSAVVDTPVSAPPASSTSETPASAGAARRATRPANPVAVPVASRSDSAVPRRDEVIPRAPVIRAEPLRPDYEAQAAAAFNAGDLSTAREKFELAARFAPTARVWTNYGVTLQRLGDFGRAASAYQSAIGIDANYLEAWLYQGRLAAQQGDVARAIPMFQRARAINPRHVDVNVELARLEWDARNLTETRRFAEEAVRSDPTNARAQWYLAISSDELKDVDVAVRAFAAYLQNVGAAEREQAEYVGWARTRLALLRGKP